MKKAGIVVFLSVLLTSAGFHAGAQERRMVASLEIRPEYAMPIKGIEGFDLSGITVTAAHPEITQVSISSGKGVDALFLENSDYERRTVSFEDRITASDRITVSFY